MFSNEISFVIKTYCMYTFMLYKLGYKIQFYYNFLVVYYKNFKVIFTYNSRRKI